MNWCSLACPSLPPLPSPLRTFRTATKMNSIRRLPRISHFCPSSTTIPRPQFVRFYSVHQRSFDESVPTAARQKVTLANLRKMYMTNQKLAVMTAYDYPSGTFADRAGSDIVLVGDSLGMVCLGYESTNLVTLSVPAPPLVRGH